jgi:hypothetical protein
VLRQRRVAACGDPGHLEQVGQNRDGVMRTIFVRVTDETTPSYAPVHATPITSTTFSIESVHPDFSDVTLEFGAGDTVRCKVGRLRGPGEPTGRQRMIAVERIP